jgi:hypothetical protein
MYVSDYASKNSTKIIQHASRAFVRRYGPDWSGHRGVLWGLSRISGIQISTVPIERGRDRGWTVVWDDLWRRRGVSMARHGSCDDIRVVVATSMARHTTQIIFDSFLG